MSESALDRTARALDLVPYLLEHQGISIAELAQVFGVSEKQINDDLIFLFSEEPYYREATYNFYERICKS